MTYPAQETDYPLLFKAQGPICKSRAEALKMPGPLYTHVKRGGVYRFLGWIKYAGDIAADRLDGKFMALYEALFPDDHEFYTRPASEFREIVTDAKGTHPRFQFETNRTAVVVADSQAGA